MHKYLFLLCFIPLLVFAQKKEIITQKIDNTIKIDGIIDEPEWQQVKPASNFIQYSPYNGKRPTFETYAWFLYSDNALYIAIYLQDHQPDSIKAELCKRDETDDANTDMVSVDIDPFNSGINAFEFKVTAAGVQRDSKYSSNGEDDNWNAVWQSAVHKHDSGWNVEYKIPFSAIRFPKNENQEWSINIWRQIRRYREWSTWNYVDNKEDGIFNQSGKISNIKNIKPPLRLSFMPYVSGYLQKDPNITDLSYSYNAGMDVKYGINESFTIDMTLIPDFGQVQSDDKILNLQPFEVKYDEKRPFFTEGTEMFDKGDVFYSRRIGNTPQNYYTIEDSLASNEEISENPEKCQMINATKLTGRTEKGLGIGVFNAMTTKAEATIIDTTTGNKRKLETQPFTNYNVFVFDKSLKNNSYITFINTNKSLYKTDYMANISGTEFRLKTKSNKYALTGSSFISNINNTGTSTFGHTYFFDASKVSGKFRYGISHETISDNYNPNDMGYLDNNNEQANSIQLQYLQLEPFWRFINWSHYVSIDHTKTYNPSNFSALYFYYNTYATFKNYLSTGININFSPIESYNYYEPRVWGYKFTEPAWFNFGQWISPDYRKNIALNCNYGFYIEKDRSYSYWWGAGPRIRINDKLMIIYAVSANIDHNNIGYNTHFTDSLNNLNIIFSKRNIKTITNTCRVNYIFNNKASLSFRMRHYWLALKNKDFFKLQNNGSIIETTYNDNENINYTIFNIDMSYIWQFAPGSEMAVVWKYAVQSNESVIQPNIAKNMQHTFELLPSNSLSLKILYYIDYEYLKNIG